MDTSGSMDTSLLAQCVAEVQKLATLAPEITLVVADARVQKVVEPAGVKAFLRQRRLPGGGGTDHRPVFEWVEGRAVSPDLFVGITDLYTRFPARPPKCPVVWVAPSPHGRAPWGHVVEIP